MLTQTYSSRERLLAGLPVAERRLELGGVSTPVLEGGDGPPLLLLHGPGEFAAKWSPVIPDLLDTHRVLAPDLPGHGASRVSHGALDAERVMGWMHELVEEAGGAAVTVVGHVLGGAIAARFAARRDARLARLVLVDSLGLAPFRPAPMFGLTLAAFVLRPSEATYRRFLPHCLHDPDEARDVWGDRWDALLAYNVDRARNPSSRGAMRTLMKEVGVPAIPPDELARIRVPTSLVWGRHDRANRLRVAEAASARYGWPLHVVENAADDPIVEQPAAFVAALRRAIAG